MKTEFNRIAFIGAVAMCAAALLAGSVAVASPALRHAPETKSSIVTLSGGLTGDDIQQALDQLPAAGGEVILPPGTFAISRPIVLRRNYQTLCGWGSETVLRLTDNANCPVIILGEPVNRPHRTVEHVVLSGLFIDGNRAHQRRELWQRTLEGSEIRNNGITVQDVSDSTVRNVTCAHCRSGGLVTTLGVRRLWVQHLEAFDNEFDGLACYSTVDSRFEELNLHDNPGAGISLDLSFDHNSVTDAVLTGNDLGIFMRSSCDNQFENVSIRRSRHFGVFIAQADVGTPLGVRPVPHTECTDNIFMNLYAKNCGGPAFHVNDASCVNNVVTAVPIGSGLHGGSGEGSRAAF